MLNVTRNELYNEEEDILHYWELMFKACQTNQIEYTRLLDYLGTVFQSSFENYPPLPVVGDFWGQQGKVLVARTNPEKQEVELYEKFEEQDKTASRRSLNRLEHNWAGQLYFALNYFRFMRDNKIESMYYQKLDKLVNYYKQATTKNTQLYEGLQKYVVQTHIVPFYGEKVKIKEINELMQGAFKRIRKFYLGNDYDILVITDKTLYKKLVEIHLLTKEEGEEKKKPKKVYEIFSFRHIALEQRGIVVDLQESWSNEELRQVAREMRKITSWNRENYWKNKF